jgi:uncharacterized protein YjbI with pentapeptide repeats
MSNASATRAIALLVCVSLPAPLVWAAYGFPSERPYPDLLPLSESSRDITGQFLWGLYAQNENLRSIAGDQGQLVSANLKQANLTGVSLRYADFFMAQMQNTKLMRSDSTGADFSFAQLGNADFSDAVADESVFYQSEVNGARFDRASLIGADFRAASAAGTNFARADLTNAKFGPRTPSGSQRARPSVESADFRGANLLGVTGMESTTGAAIYDANTILGSIEPLVLGWILAAAPVANPIPAVPLWLMGIMAGLLSFFGIRGLGKA